MYEAAAAASRAALARSEARLHLLRAAAELERVGDYEAAERILVEVRRQQKEETC